MNLYQPTITGSLSVSGSVNISGSISIAGGGTISGTASIATTALTASSADNFLTRGTLTAQTLVVQTITSSVDFVTGSTRFGSLSSNTHVFTGSLAITGGLAVSAGSVGVGTTTPKSYLHLSGDNSFNTPLADVLLTRYYTNDSLVAGSSLFHFYNNTDSKEYLAVGVAGSGGTGGKPNQLSQIKMVVGASGNVGIGTSSPIYPIDVYTNISSSINIQAQFFNDNFGSGVKNFIRVRNGIGVGSTYSSYFGQGSDRKTYIIANNTSRNDLVINGDDGYVGIGTNAAVVPLHVVGSGGVVRIGDASNNLRIGNDGGGTYLEQYGTSQATSAFRIQSSKAGNAVDYTAISIDPYSGLNVTKSGTGGNNVFASGVPIQVVYGAAIASSGPQGTGVSLGPACNGTTPTATQGLQIASVSFTPKKADSIILIQTNSVAMWERVNASDHFYLFAANATDGTILVKAGQYLQSFGSNGQNGGIVCLQGVAASWGTSAKTISFRIGSSGDNGPYYEYNPYYNVGGFSNATVGNFTYVITEIGQ